MNVKVITKCGGKIIMGSLPHGVGIGFFPSETDDSFGTAALDIYQCALNRRSIKLLIQSIRGKGRFETRDGLFFLDAADSTQWRIGFMNQHHRRWHEASIHFFDFPKIEGILFSESEGDLQLESVRVGKTKAPSS